MNTRPLRILTWLAVAATVLGCGQRRAVLLIDGGPADSRPPIDLPLRDWRPAPDWPRPPDLFRVPDAPRPPDMAIPPDQAIPPDTKPASAWTVMLTATPGALNDLWGTASDNVYAVGEKGLVMHFDGSGWTKSIAGSGQSNLMGIWGKSASQIHAVGDDGEIIFDGSGWQNQNRYPQPLLDVWGGSQYLFAPSGSYPGLRFREIGPSNGYWSMVPLYGVTEGQLNAVWAQSDSAVYAVGENGTIVGCESTSCASSSSTAWKLMPSGTTNHLTAIYGFSTTAIFAVGLGGTILRYDGATWSKQPVSTATYFYGVWGSSPSDVYAVGHPIFQPDESIFHYDGKSWTKLPPPKPTNLNAVWGASPTDVLAVGQSTILRLKP